MIRFRLFVGQLREQFVAHRALYVLAICYLAFAIALQKWAGFTIMWQSPATLITYGSYMLLIIALIAPIFKTFAIMISANPGEPTRQLIHWVDTNYIARPRLANGLHATATFFVIYGTFATLKSAIPFIVPFSWDTTFYELDTFLFWGGTAWEAWSLRSLPAFIFIIINFFYNLWLIVLIAFLTFFGFANSSPVRTAFLTSAMMTFVFCGTVLAIVFSSAGPCFYGQVVGGHDPYAEHMAFLKEMHAGTGMIWAVHAQNLLWDNYILRFDGMVSGISAMPSLHVALAVLMALASWHVNRIFGVIMTLFGVIISVGSVVLAWHYAVDGIVGGGAAALIWLLVSSHYEVARNPHHSLSMQR